MSQIPAVLRSALESRSSNRAQSPPPVALRSGRVARGDLRVIRALAHETADPRVGLVLAIDGDNDFAEVLLVHTAPEMACEVDGILPRHLTSAPYDVVVETDLRGAVWTLQLAGAVGHVDEGVLQALSRTASGRIEGSDERSEERAIHSGPRLAGPSDARWAFKAAEGDSLRRLALDCTDALLDEGMVWLADPRLLRPELLDLTDDREGLIGELLHWVATRTVTIAAADLELLASLGVLDHEAWSGLGDLGIDVWTGLQGLIESAATSTADAGSALAAGYRLVTATHLEPSAQIIEIDVVHYLGRKEAVSA